jgi:D-arabinose 1-dehydrogenase-like Zn-dependent alcohol dehydrogenase
MKAARFEEKGEPLKLVDVSVPEPKPGQIRIKVVACGICHSDVIAKFNFMGGGFPRIPGHELAGTVDKVGEGANFKVGERVAVGWFGGSCHSCKFCKVDEPVCCEKLVSTGIVKDGGYAQYALAEAEAVARIPEGLSFEEAGPLMCAGVTVFNALRNSSARPGDLVAIVGIGGLGHLGVQFSKNGF